MLRGSIYTGALPAVFLNFGVESMCLGIGVCVFFVILYKRIWF